MNILCFPVSEEPQTNYMQLLWCACGSHSFSEPMVLGRERIWKRLSHLLWQTVKCQLFYSRQSSWVVEGFLSCRMGLGRRWEGGRLNGVSSILLVMLGVARLWLPRSGGSSRYPSETHGKACGQSAFSWLEEGSLWSLAGHTSREVLETELVPPDRGWCCAHGGWDFWGKPSHLPWKRYVLGTT